MLNTINALYSNGNFNVASTVYALKLSSQLAHNLRRPKPYMGTCCLNTALIMRLGLLECDVDVSERQLDEFPDAMCFTGGND